MLRRRAPSWPSHASDSSSLCAPYRIPAAPPYPSAVVHCKKFCSNSSKSMSGFCPGQTRLQRLQNEAFRDFLKIDIYMYLHGSVQAPTGNASSVSRFFDIAATRSCALWARSYFHPIPDQARQTFRTGFFCRPCKQPSAQETGPQAFGLHVGFPAQQALVHQI